MALAAVSRPGGAPSSALSGRATMPSMSLDVHEQFSGAGKPGVQAWRVEAHTHRAIPLTTPTSLQELDAGAARKVLPCVRRMARQAGCAPRPLGVGRALRADLRLRGRRLLHPPAHVRPAGCSAHAAPHHLYLAWAASGGATTGLTAPLAQPELRRRPAHWRTLPHP